MCPGAAMRPSRSRFRDDAGVDTLAPVETVSVDRADPRPGDTVGGSNVQDAWVGRLLQASVTSPPKVPPCADTVTRYVAELPAVTVALSVATAIENPATVIRRSTGSENADPTVLAATLAAVVPIGQVIAEPVPEPHPPDQLRRVAPHPFGSTKPS